MTRAFNRTEAAKIVYEGASPRRKGDGARASLYRRRNTRHRSMAIATTAIRIYRELLEKYPREKYAWTILSAGSIDEWKHVPRSDRVPGARPRARSDVRSGPQRASRTCTCTWRTTRRRSRSSGDTARSIPATRIRTIRWGRRTFAMGRLDEAARMYEKAFALKPMLGSAVMLAYLCGMRGDYREAISWIEQDMQTGDAAPGQLVGRLYLESGVIAYASGNSTEALEDARRAFAIADSTGNIGMMGVAMQAEGACALRMGTARRGSRALRRAIRRSRIRSPTRIPMRPPSGSATSGSSMWRQATSRSAREAARTARSAPARRALRISRRRRCARRTGWPFSMRRSLSRRVGRTTPFDAWRVISSCRCRPRARISSM